MNRIAVALVVAVSLVSGTAGATPPDVGVRESQEVLDYLLGP